MFKKIFDALFKSKEKSEINILVATLKDKIMPIDRGMIYEDPLDEYLQEMNIGGVIGGGTLQLENGEVGYCDIEIKLNANEIDKNIIENIIKKLEEFGAPKGSFLRIEKTGEEIEFGLKEDIGIYIDGKNLPEKVYENCDINFVVSELKRLLGDQSEIVRFWYGEYETGLYFYGNNPDEMKYSINNFISTYPLCENARIVKIT